ncbi:MAG: penicillin-binding protein 1A [bacterium]
MSKRRIYMAGKVLRITGLLVLLLLMLAAGAGVSGLRFLRKDLPSAQELETYRPPLVTRFFDLHDSLLAEFYIERRNPVPLRKVPKYMVDAVITMEDRKFYQHWGVNLLSVFRAALLNLRAGKVVRGGSTITQQLARALFLTQERSFVRKMKEALLAMEIERTYSKDRILEMYLNQIYFGHGAYGIESAAKTYFHKNVNELTLGEAALLAGVIRSPAAYSPLSNPERALRRRSVVLQAMVDAGKTTRREAAQANNSPLGISASRPVATKGGPYFVEEVRKFIERRFGSRMLYRDGVNVYTTLDLDLQNKAEEALEVWLSAYETAHKFESTLEKNEPLPESLGFEGTSYIQAALVAVDPQTGYVKAMVGGRSFEDSKFNRATQARRQPGSAFKPFLWAAAVDNGFTASDIVQDSPIIVQVQDTIYKPSNYDHKFLGPITLRKALARSRNLVAIRLIQDIGESTVSEYAKRMGIRSRLARVLSLALGSSTTSLLEMVSAYGVFANQGVRVEPTMIRSIVGRDGEALYEDLPYSVRVLSPQTTYIVTSMLQSVLNEGTGYGARLRGFTRPAAGKTGTTDNYSDAWFVGFTPELVCGVWVGFDQMKKIARNATGANVALPAWTEFMKAAVEGKPAVDFVVPEDIVHASVCTKTGLLATSACPTPRDEVFIKGTEPREFCSAHKIGVDKILEDEYQFERLDRKSLESEEFNLSPGTR